MYKNIFIKTLALVSILLSLSSCKKFLGKKSNKQLVVPSTLKDLQAILDYNSRINFAGAASSETSADNYYINYTDYNSLSSEADRKMYTWGKDHLFDNFQNDWSRVYDLVYYANTVLEGLQKIEKNAANEQDWDHLKGQALFLRANAFSQVLSVWALAYDSATAVGTLGIPLRLNTDFNETSVRSSLADSYSKVISDVKESIALLPVTPLHVFRASRPAAYGLLARTFLWMRNYDVAGKYADSCLQLKNTLLDYNSPSVSQTATFAFQIFNPETVFYMEASGIPPTLDPSRAKIDSILYASYTANDLRKLVFFKSNNNGTYGFKGSYTQNSTLFAGIATDEMYLTRAECYARSGDVTAAMNDLNTLLVKRWKTNTYIQMSASSASDALSKILIERRKELLMRGLRWMDIKRLNKEGANIELKRILNGQTYSLQPNDLRFALPLPEAVIEISGMPQNPR